MSKPPQTKKEGRGWHGDSEGHAKAGQKGGQTTIERYGPAYYETIGKQGGHVSPGKFSPGSDRARNAGRKGGEARGLKNES